MSQDASCITAVRMPTAPAPHLFHSCPSPETNYSHLGPDYPDRCSVRQMHLCIQLWVLGDHQGDLKTFWGIWSPSCCSVVLPKARFLAAGAFALGMHLTLGGSSCLCTRTVHWVSPTPHLQCAHDVRQLPAPPHAGTLQNPTDHLSVTCAFPPLAGSVGTPLPGVEVRIVSENPQKDGPLHYPCRGNEEDTKVSRFALGGTGIARHYHPVARGRGKVPAARGSP